MICYSAAPNNNNNKRSKKKRKYFSLFWNVDLCISFRFISKMEYCCEAQHTVLCQAHDDDGAYGENFSQTLYVYNYNILCFFQSSFWPVVCYIVLSLNSRIKCWTLTFIYFQFNVIYQPKNTAYSHGNDTAGTHTHTGWRCPNSEQSDIYWLPVYSC